jgi:hypothetical protein
MYQVIIFLHGSEIKTSYYESFDDAYEYLILNPLPGQRHGAILSVKDKIIVYEHDRDNP